MSPLFRAFFSAHLSFSFFPPEPDFHAIGKWRFFVHFTKMADFLAILMQIFIKMVKK